MRKFSIGEKVILKEDAGNIFKGTVVSVIDFCISNSQYMYKVCSLSGGCGDSYEENLKRVDKYICPECGGDFFDEDIAQHLMLEHGYDSEGRSPEVQAESDMSDMSDMIDFKAKQYDKIADMLFMSCGIIENGDSIRYIVDPETVCDELLRIIVSDKGMDRGRFIAKKRTYFNEGDNSQW